MANFIVKMIQRARNFFGTFNENIFTDNNWQPEIRKLANACFNSPILTDGEEVPNDRCCRTCGKIGHFSKDCPKSRKNIRKLMKDPNYIQEMTQMKCFVCQQPGHIAKQCTQRRAKPEPKKSWRQDNRRRRNSSEREVLVKKVEENRENGKREYRNRRRQRYNRGNQRNDENRKAETEKSEREIKRMIGMLKLSDK